MKIAYLARDGVRLADFVAPIASAHRNDGEFRSHNGASEKVIFIIKIFYIDFFNKKNL